MIPKRVTLRNFLSFGDEEQTFDFTEPDEVLWILTGPNGVGKSAVFDAITYCLFTEHRGGGQDAKSLIKHGANGFHVSFEFEFSGENYRIFRGRPASTSQPTQRVERFDSAAKDWKAIVGVNSATDVKNWVRDTLGLRFETFASSVLLRQGQSDVIVEATGKERLEVLKRIIDVERFEALSARLTDAAKEHWDRFKQLKLQRETQAEVTEVEVAAAKDILKAAEAARAASQEAKLGASQRIEQAKQYARLDGERTGLDRQLQEADERAKQRKEIEESHERFGVLQAVVPPLRKIATAQTRIADAEVKQQKQASALALLDGELKVTAAALEKARTEATAHEQVKVEHENEARRLGKEVEGESKFLTTAEQVAALAKQLAGFAPDLDAKLKAAEEWERSSGDAIAAASNEKTAAATRLQQTRAQQKEFDTVGATCSRCRQPVTEKHAAEERAKLERDIAELTKQHDAAALALTTAQHERLAAKADADSHKNDVQTRKSARDKFELQKKMLDEVGIQSDPTALKVQLDAKRAVKSQCERQALAEAGLAKGANDEAKRLDTSSKKQAADRAALDSEIRTIDTTLATHRAERDTLLATLPSDWQSSLAAGELERLVAELSTLESSGIARDFAALQSDSRSQIERASRREAVLQELAGLPTGSIADAEVAVIEAAMASLAAERVRDAANSAVERLDREATAFELLLAEVGVAETRYDRHRKLNDWLGKKGLMLALVREAERDIVRFAQETLNNLSGGDLEISILDQSDGSEEALKLVVRRQGSEAPIPVKYLSGSQKFRVAVAIAVAIGKFAAGPAAARPLESVIIDEGFGSLDQEGLVAMREELENLKNSQTLKRIILVSHQKEFTSGFPVGYRLEPGENGATATKFHSGQGAGD